MFSGCRKKASPEETLEYEAKKELQYLSMCFDVYFENYRRIPTTAYEATAEFAELIPESWKNAEKAFDPWGSTYRFSATEEGFRIWSPGPNRIDEKGSGDDLIREFP
jgi:hypothetical protein